MRILDVRQPTPCGDPIDLLGFDAEGRFVLIETKIGPDNRILDRLLDHYHWFESSIELFQRLFAAELPDPRLPPRGVLPGLVVRRRSRGDPSTTDVAEPHSEGPGQKRAGHSPSPAWSRKRQSHRFHLTPLRRTEGQSDNGLLSHEGAPAYSGYRINTEDA